MSNARFFVLAFAFVVLALATAQATPTSAAAFTVNSTGDAGDVTPGNGVCATAGAVCTLRAAIDEANALAGMDTINFNIPAGSAGCVGATNPVCTITPATAFTSINAQVTINGYTQPGASANTNPIASGSNAVLKIELNGTSAGAGTTGLIVNVGSLTSIRGLVINRFGGAGILVSGAGTHTVAGNYIGTNVTGTTDLGNNAQGVIVSSSSSIIGGTAAADRNVISGNNQHGIEIQSTSTAVLGNYVGTNATGSADLGNTLNGIMIGASSTCVGGSIVATVCTGAAGAENVISGNDAQGIEINGGTVQSNTVYGNLIGTNAAGTASIGNTGSGIIFLSAINNVVGGIGGNQSNRIAFNGGDGVFVSTGTGNAIRGNRIYSNTGLGIDLGANGVTPNDAAPDSDTGANNLQNFPVLTAAYSGSASTIIRGSLTSSLSTSFAVHFYASSACDSSGNGEGETFTSSTNVATDASGFTSLNLTLGVSAPVGQFLTATATRNAAPLDTSEFSACVPITHILVNSTADPGDGVCDGAQCTLREAITSANSATGTDTIDFNIPAVPDPNCVDGTGVCTITPASALPNVSQPIVIDGYTQTGASANTNPINMGSNAVLKIELNGTSAGAGQTGLIINGGSSAVRGLAINRFGGSGIFLGSPGGNIIRGNFVGTDVAGAADLGNTSDGILVGSGSNEIGGLNAADRNVISGNGVYGIELGTGSNAIAGNFIGTNAAGTGGVGNSFDGIQVTSSGNCIGGTFVSSVCTPAAGSRNVLSGNGSSGIEINGGGGTAASNNIVSNYIGTNAAGTAAVTNGTGIEILSANSNNIGGAATPPGTGLGNLISGNGTGILMNGAGLTGVFVQGNLIGTQADGVSALGNTTDGIVVNGSPLGDVIGGSLSASEGNRIAFNGQRGVWVQNGQSIAVAFNEMYSNGQLGIDLGAVGVTENDLGSPPDQDTGANNLQNFPDITSAVKIGGTTQVGMTLNSVPNTNFSVQLYANSTCDPSGNGEGQTFLGTFSTSTPASGIVSFMANVTPAVAVGQQLTAIANRLTGPFDTSEFSDCVAVTGMTVDSTSDASLTACTTAAADCSLRGAITNANGDAVADTINFNVPGCPGGICTITPTSALPVISQPVTIDGYTQPGAAANTNDTSAGLNSALKIELNGTSAGAGVNGLEIFGANTVIRGLVVNRFQGDGIFLSTLGGNAIAGNFIGTNVAGSADLGNLIDGIGISFDGNCIGGTYVSSVCMSAAAHRNLISGNNDDGVSIGSASAASFVLGNIIGLDAGGTIDLGNTSEGVSIFMSSNSQIGGTNAVDRNIISGNESHGVVVNGGTGNKVYGNYIGTDISGSLDVGNTLNGVATTGSAASSTIGTLSGGRNLISGNNGHGVSLSGATNEAAAVVNNYIGTNVAGTVAIANSGDGIFTDTGGHAIGAVGFPLWNLISGNLGNGIHFSGASASNTLVRTNRIGTQVNTAMPLKNGLSGILFDASADINTVGGTAASQGNIIVFNGGDGVRVDGAASINNTVRSNSIHSNQGKAIENINGGNVELAPPVVTAAGSASGTACVNCTVDVYSDDSSEGRVYHGSATADGAGNWTFAGAVTGPNVLATATNASGSTSEFSTPFTGCADTDGDRLCNSGDACPNDSDCDNDGWSDGNELAFIGTDYQDACPENTLDNAWPPDLNNDGLVDVIGDIARLAGFYAQSVPPAPARYDVNEPPNGLIDVIGDIVRVSGLYAQSCVP